MVAEAARTHPGGDLARHGAARAPRAHRPRGPRARPAGGGERPSRRSRTLSGLQRTSLPTRPVPAFPGTLRVLGPGIVWLALAQGSSELIWWPYLIAKYGLAFLFLLVPACLLQLPVNYHIGAYTVLTGESIFQGFRRLSPWFAGFLYVFMAVSFFWFGAFASAGGTSLAALTGFPEGWSDRAGCSSGPIPRSRSSSSRSSSAAWSTGSSSSSCGVSPRPLSGDSSSRACTPTSSRRCPRSAAGSSSRTSRRRAPGTPAMRTRCSPR